jgi:type I restriction-modification system DNA methylase subunit
MIDDFNQHNGNIYRHEKVIHMTEKEEALINNPEFNVDSFWTLKCKRQKCSFIVAFVKYKNNEYAFFDNCYDLFHSFPLH